MVSQGESEKVSEKVWCQLEKGDEGSMLMPGYLAQVMTCSEIQSDV